MTRLITLFSVLTVLILFTAALTAPVRVEGAVLEPATNRASAVTGNVDIHLGDGIFRLKVRACEGCGPLLTLEIAVPKMRIAWVARS